MKRTRRRSGFTRVETVAVVGVAGAVGALALPVAAQGTILDLIFGRKAASAQPNCQSNLKQIMLGVLQYQQDYDEISPRATYGGDSYGWANVIQPYVRSTQLFQCPAEKHTPPELQQNQEGAPDAMSPRDEMQAMVRRAGFTDYWLNSRMSGAGIAAIVEPAQTVSMGDGDGGAPASTARYNIAALPGSWLKTQGSPARRHDFPQGEGANYAFADGHVKWHKPGDIQARGKIGYGGKPTFLIK